MFSVVRAPGTTATTSRCSGSLRLTPIDGKTARRSGRRRGLAPLHLITAWAGANHVSLGQLAVDDKSDEITAIPRLPELLDLDGALVTIDAMGWPLGATSILRRYAAKASGFTSCSRGGRVYREV